MIVLLVADDIDHLVDGIIAEAEFGCADVLGHVDRRSVAAEQQLVVEAVAGEVGPDGTVVLAVEHTFFKPFEHLLLAFEVGVGLVIYLVEVDAHARIGLIESVIDPGVHGLPKLAHLGIFLFPAA